MTNKPNPKTKTKTNTKTPVSSPKHPPVVVVLGHVDHGKTTLLDTIRKTNVVAREAGGITQHIGAYQVQTDPKNPQTKITFIDTPGHEAFSKMRSRGAALADIAILVVAANDGVKPQTKEAIAHIKKAQIPFIVAINKVDLEGVNLDVVKAQLAEQEVYVEGYGGDVVAVPISAIKGTHIDQLLEMIHLVWEMTEVKEQPNELQAVVLESYIDGHKGVILNLLVRRGQLCIAQSVSTDTGVAGKVRSLHNDLGEPIRQANPSQPVQMLGFKTVIEVGATIGSGADTKKAVTNSQDQLDTLPTDQAAVGEEAVTKLKIILKTDVTGTLEAIKANLTDEIVLVGEGVGDISESDVLLSRSTGARIIGFHVLIPRGVVKLAEMEGVKMETYTVIYHLLEDLQKQVLKLMEPTINEEELGRAEVIAEFSIRGSHIAGCMVASGEIHRPARIRVLRDDHMVAEPRIGAMQVLRKEVTEAKKGQEVALVFRPDVKFKVGDTIVSYKIVDD